MTLNVKLTQLDTTTDTDGGFMYIVLPIGGGAYKSWKIDPASLQQDQDVLTDKVTNQGADFPKAFDASTFLQTVDFAWVSGTPIITVGTTNGGTEITGLELSVPTDGALPVNVNSIYLDATTIYIGISGGVVNVNFRYIQNYF